MVKLSDFLGGLVSSISDARVYSDIQSVKIAEEYAKNDLLKHFAIPRMRVDKVEINIPVAVEKLIEKSRNVYEPIDNVKFSSIAYQQILKTLVVTNLPSEISKTLKTSIADNIHLLESKIRLNQTENVLQDFANNVAQKVIESTELIFQGEKRKRTTKGEILNLQGNLANELQSALKDQIKFQTENKDLESIQVIVEADRLREINPQNFIIIKMTVSEQGMEWVKMQNGNGELDTKLMPE